MPRWKTIAAAVAIMASVAASGVCPAAATPMVNLGALAHGDGAAQIQQAQFVWGGRQFCWYPGGWNGPGWYWCGHAWRRGIGWGGPVGWHGWRAPGHIHHRPPHHRPGWNGGHHRPGAPGGAPHRPGPNRPGGGGHHGGGRPSAGGRPGGRH